MIITETVNSVADSLTGFTAAGAALSTAIIGWVLFWTRMAKLIPTEWPNPVLRTIFRVLNLTCRIFGLDWPNIAQVQFKPFRVVTHAELTATKVVNAAVVPEAVIDNPPPPAAPTEEVK